MLTQANFSFIFFRSETGWLHCWFMQHYALAPLSFCLYCFCDMLQKLQRCFVWLLHTSWYTLINVADNWCGGVYSSSLEDMYWACLFPLTCIKNRFQTVRRQDIWRAGSGLYTFTDCLVVPIASPLRVHWYHTANSYIKTQLSNTKVNQKM